ALSTAEHRGVAISVHDDSGALVPGAPEPDRVHRHGRSDARALRERRKSNPEIASLGAKPLLLSSQVGVARELKRLIHVGRVIARIECESGGQLVWHRRGWDEICSSHVRGIAAELSRKIVHHTLNQKCRFGMAGTAVRTGRRAVRVDTDHFGVNIWDVV